MTPETRRAQLGRIHQAKAAMRLADDAYRDLLESLTGCRSAAECDDGQVNHVLDWLNYLSGYRRARPAAFGRVAAEPGGHSTLTAMRRLARAMAGWPPPNGWSVNPLASPAWRARMIGDAETRRRGDAEIPDLEDLDEAQLVKLIEGFKAIRAREADRAANMRAGKLPF